MNITGKITGINYKILLSDELKKLDFERFNINSMPSSCLVSDGFHTLAISKWVSPKRTRSYPYERIYNTLKISKKITVIPIVKDEGSAGDRDFIQWDTVSLMSLLDVFVIFAYYDDAVIAGQKITDQKFNNDYVISKIKEIESYHSSALHWNLKEIKTNLHDIIDKAKYAYHNIEINTGVKLHGFDGIDKFKLRIGNDASTFLDYSRGKAEQAQKREFVTIQPKERLSTLTKAKITINNYLGGLYYFTVDEIDIIDKTVYLIEGKHSGSSLLPSKGDIKDGLIKMILYCNLSDVMVDDISMKSVAVLELTSNNLNGEILSINSDVEIDMFLSNHGFNGNQINLVNTLFQEAQTNGFIIKLKGVE